MDIVQIIVLIMVVTILVTITLAAAAYAAFRMRERRAPRSAAAETTGPVFFERVRFPTLDEATGDATVDSSPPYPARAAS
jgi:hypothetical protein